MARRRRNNPKQGGLWDNVPPRDARELAEKFPNLGKSWKPNPHPRKLVDRYTVDLNAEELAMGQRMALTTRAKGRHEHAQTTLANQQHWTKEQLDEVQFLGQRSELRVGKCFDFAIPPDYLHRKRKNDFGPINGPGICVRGSKYNEPSIIVRPDDRDDSIAIGVQEESHRRGRVHAWCWVRDAKRTTPLTNPPVRAPNGEMVDGDQWAHFVKLHLIGDDGKKYANPIVHFLGNDPEHDDPIPEAILKLIPKGFKVW